MDHVLEAKQETTAIDPAVSHRHPLDSLSIAEIEETARLLKTSKQLSDAVRFVSITLHEPSRQSVAGFNGDAVSARQALAVFLDRSAGFAYEAVVDLVSKTVVSFTQLPAGIQPPIMLDEFFEAEAAARRDPQFLAALARRGITNADLVMVDPWSAGLYGTELPEHQCLRLLQALIFVRSEERDNGYARPLDNLTVLIDLHKMAVVHVKDYGTVPLPPESGNWAREYIPHMRTDLKPIEILQPEGPSFQVSGNLVEWQKWKFRVGFTHREGLVLHTVSYTDESGERPILQRASICEMVVPYGDPGEPYYRKNAFDIGEYGIGMLANSLALGCDCLGVIHYFDFPLVDSLGKASMLKNVVCLHEEDFGILWKHTDWRTNQSEVRRSRRLSVSFIATVGNYEYGFYWYFYQDGTIQCEVKLTGIVNTTSLPPGQQSEFGVEIAPQLNAGNHQHIFAARLVASVDGPANSVYEVNTAGMPTSPANPHGNAFRSEETLLATELQAQRRVNADSARFWRIKSSHRKNKLGRPVAYRLIPGENCPPFVQPDAPIMRRAGFTANHLWVTPYRPEERFAAGDYPNQHPTGDGLPVWTKGDRPITDTEVVLWYVFTNNHVPRPEDWPVMPVGSIGFQLKPDGFFDRNPAMDVPPPPPKMCHH